MATVNTTLAIPGVLVIAVDLGLWQLDYFKGDP